MNTAKRAPHAVHHFHIPVMGIGYTIDTPLKVAHLGINSVVSLVDDILIEKMRKHHSSVAGLPYVAIADKDEDARARRITAYLDLLHNLCSKRYEALKQSRDMLQYYMDLLPQNSALRKAYEELPQDFSKSEKGRKWLDDNLMPGSIDVNVMTKLDRMHLDAEGKPMASEHNDAHAAVRGYALSSLESTMVLSAGMNPRLYGYLESFDCFYPASDGHIPKKIAIKVSDYRSAIVQGRFLAKKGIWVSEYRIESGLNCGGHAFATDGYLMGPILAEFAEKRSELEAELYSIVCQALAAKGKALPPALRIKLSAQGGVGTSGEHAFLRKHYGVDSVGWGSPFLLVPEVSNVDAATLSKLAAAREEDLELSNISPMGVPFHNLKGNSKDEEKLRNIKKGRPGSACPKGYIAIDHSLREDGLCKASRLHQHLQIKALKEQELSTDAFDKAYNAIVEKSCICVGLGTSALLVNNLDHSTEGEGVSVCPGPNIAYFSQQRSLAEMARHIYGTAPLNMPAHRPHMFIKELWIYVNYLLEQIAAEDDNIDARRIKYYNNFHHNMLQGMAYYKSLFSEKLAPLYGFEGKYLEEIQFAVEALNAAIQPIAEKELAAGKA